MKKFLFCFAGILISFNVIAQLNPFVIPVSPQEFPENYLITGTDITNLLQQRYKMDAEITEYNIEKHGKKYFLLAHDDKHSQTYAFRLRRARAIYNIFLTDAISSCNCDMSIEKFTFRKNKIVGCKGIFSTAGLY